MLSLRRFPDTITRWRHASGQYNGDGEYEPGPLTETELRASVQPVTLQDIDSEAGARLQERRKVYVPLPDALRAASDDAVADRVLIGGVAFVVEDSMSWRHHTHAIVLRSS